MAGAILVTGSRAFGAGTVDGEMALTLEKKRKKFEMGLKMRSGFKMSHCHHRSNYSPKV